MRAVGSTSRSSSRRGEGAYLDDVDGNRYLDWVHVVGAADLRARRPGDGRGGARGGARAARASARRPRREVELAAEIVDAVPSIELVRLVSSGTEAAMSALRLARGFTRPRPRSSSSPAATTATPTRCSRAPARASRRSAIPSTPGVPTAVDRRHDRRARTTTSTPSPTRSTRYGEGLAAIIVEPVAGNMGVVPPRRGFLEALRALCDASGALLVFDEVITGFRVARGGAQERYGVTARPDRPRQDRRRRAAARRVRRPRRRDGAARAGRRRLPGRHALREPARDRRRPLGAPPAARPGGLRRARAPRRAARGGPRAVRRACSASARC